MASNIKFIFLYKEKKQLKKNNELNNKYFF